jgi:hypothetical protein
MSSFLNLHSYQNLTIESFNIVSPSPIISLNPPFFVYSEQLHLIFCTLCRLALPGKSSISRHLANPPHHLYWRDLDKTTRASILSILRSYPLMNYHQIPEIPPNTYYFRCLPLRFDTYKCPDCPYFTLDSKKAR